MALDTITAGTDLELRQLALGDLPALTEVVLAERDALAPWLPDIARIEGPRGVEMWLDRRLHAAGIGNGAYYGVWWNDRLVGVAGVHDHREHLRMASMGCWLAADAQGSGVMTRAVVALAARAVERFDLGRIEWTCPATNTASRRLAERAGFHLEGTHPAAAWDDGAIVAKVTYGLLAPES